ncbi:MAG: hypothetical protein Q4A41_00530 [Bacillota bacterium]|nr:hypothetical protein [Bacillota bacterium]
MEEKLRKELHQLWMRKSEGEITRDEYRDTAKKLIEDLLEENPQRLLDLCKGHISGLPEAHLLQMAREKTEEFVFMNISAGSYTYTDVAKKSSESVQETSRTDAEKIEDIYRELLALLGMQDKEIDAFFAEREDEDEYEDEPALTLLDRMIEEDLCAAIDWKFGPDDVEYNLNVLAKKLRMAPIKEYPPYEEGQPLGYEAVELVVGECPHAAVALFDGDEICLFLTTEENAPAVKAKLDELEKYWSLDDVRIV